MSAHVEKYKVMKKLFIFTPQVGEGSCLEQRLHLNSTLKFSIPSTATEYLFNSMNEAETHRENRDEDAMNPRWSLPRSGLRNQVRYPQIDLKLTVVTYQFPTIVFKIKHWKNKRWGKKQLNWHRVHMQNILQWKLQRLNHFTHLNIISTWNKFCFPTSNLECTWLMWRAREWVPVSI